MKKLIVALFALGFCSVMAEARVRSIPVSQDGNGLASYDYGGVSYATSSFSTILATAVINADNAPGEYTVYGVLFSTGQCGSFDRVDVYDSTGAHSVHNIPSQRASFSLYNVSNSTLTEQPTANINQTCYGYQGFPSPIHFKRGLFWRPSSAGYNSIMLLYHREED